jgi:hypothetical protein
MNRKRIFVLSVVGLLVSLAPAVAQGSKPIARYRAFAVNPIGGRGANAGVVQIAVERWSTDQEREALITILKEKGSKALLDALVKLPPVGYIKMPNTLGWDLYYARQTDLPNGGKRVILATNRPLRFGEVANQTRSVNYDFTLVEMRFDKSGKGEGKIETAAKIWFNPKTHQIEIENYNAMPVQLVNITEEKS